MAKDNVETEVKLYVTGLTGVARKLEARRGDQRAARARAQCPLRQRSARLQRRRAISAAAAGFARWPTYKDGEKLVGRYQQPL